MQAMPREEKSATFSKSVPVYYCYCYFKVFILQESRTLSKSTRFEAQDKSAAFVSHFFFSIKQVHMLVTIGVAQSAKNAYCIHNDDSDLRFGYGFLPFFSVREKCPYFNIERSPTENKQNGLITICDHFKMLPVFCSLVFFYNYYYHKYRTYSIKHRDVY